MLLAVAFILGMIFGWYRAAQRGGDRLDQLQYGAAHGIVFTLIALFVMIMAQRAGLI